MGVDDVLVVEGGTAVEVIVGKERIKVEGAIYI